MRSIANGSSLMAFTVLRLLREAGPRSWTILACFWVIHAQSPGGRQRHAQAAMTSEISPSLARIPAGDFLMGSADADDDEPPAQRVFVGEFFLGRFPVTQEEYARFIRAAGHPAPAIGDPPLVPLGS